MRTETNTRRHLPERASHVAFAWCIMGLGLVVAGCGRGDGPAGDLSAATVASQAIYRLDAEPPGAVDLVAALAEAEDGDDVVVAGRIGGRGNPWIDGLAAFTIVDLSEKLQGGCCPGPSCSGAAAGPSAPQALVRIVDAGGETVATDSRQLLGIEPAQAVAVRGRARRDEAGNLTILADGVFVRP
jgi:hypothetical protein